MRFLGRSLVVTALVILMARADEPAPNKSPLKDDEPATKGSPVYEALKKELADARAKHDKDFKDAEKALDVAKKSGTNADQQAARTRLDDLKKDLPGLKFCDRFLEFAQMHPQDPMAFASAMMAFNLSPRPATADNTLGKTFAYMKDHFAAKPQIKQLVHILEERKPAAAESLLREVFNRNPDHRIQGHACKALLAVSTKPGEKDNLTKLLKGKYADLFPDLSVGKHAPEIVVKNVQGQEVKLSDLKGKVVVLDIWATWCPHCRAMIPQERQMVERLKGKPFTLVSISMDDKKDTLTDFLAKEKMPWTHCWVSPNSDLAEDWHIEYFPTVYVLDARGVIRYVGVTGEDLDKAVNELIKEMEKKK